MKFSIICASYNSEKTIIKTLDSINNQTYKNYELILVDGKSSDQTIEIVNSYKNKIENIIVLSEKDDGVYDAMNKGIGIANGDILCFLNSDDFYFSNNVLKCVYNNFISHPKIDACYSDLIYVDRTYTKNTIRYWKPGIFRPGSFSEGWMVPHPTFFANKNVYKNHGIFNLRYKLASDVDLMARLLEVKKISVNYIPEILVCMRIGGMTNMSVTNIIKQNIEIIQSLKGMKILKSSILFLMKKFFSRLKQFFLRKI